MLVNILDLEQVTVNDIMVPRNEIYGIDLEDDDATILAQLTRSTHTLVPVFTGDINKIEGILHLRNIGKCLDPRRPKPSRCTQRAYRRPISHLKTPHCTFSSVTSSSANCDLE